ncbi:MAG: hypothetical protein ACI4AD_04565 [Roseburia sp.]
MSNTIFDDVFRTMLEKMPVLIIPIINEVFHTAYLQDEKIEQFRNEHHTKNGEVITDSYLGIGDRLYHLECQSTADSRMSIRMIEYDFAIALETSQKEGEIYKINFPQSCVLYLRHDDKTPDQLQVEVKLPENNQCVYSVPTVKVQKYSEDEIFRKHLLFFLPFYIMRYEEQLKEIGENPEKVDRLVREYEDIRSRLKEELPGADEADLYTRLVELIKEISDYVLRDDEEVKERIGDIMGGKVLELETDRIMARGIEQGREEGRELGVEQATEEFVKRMLGENEDLDKVALYSGCTMEQVLQIKEKMKDGAAIEERVCRPSRIR